MKFWKLFAICQFWQRNRKQPPPHRALPYDATAGAPPQRRIRAIPWRSAAFAPSTTPAPSHSAAPTPFHTIAPVPLHDARVRIVPPHRTRAFSQRCTCAAPWRCARIDPRRRTCATPCCQVPRRSQYRTGRLAPPSALLQSCRKSGNKKVIKIATFLRLAIAADVQITDRAPKMKQTTAQCLISTLRVKRKSR